MPLAELYPGWKPPLAEHDASRYASWTRLNVKRARLGTTLSQQPRDATALADRVLDAIVWDENESANRQPIDPMLNAVGRRAVQEFLFATVSFGSCPRKLYQHVRRCVSRCSAHPPFGSWLSARERSR